MVEKKRSINEPLLRRKAKELGLDFDEYRDMFISPKE